MQVCTGRKGKEEEGLRKAAIWSPRITAGVLLPFNGNRCKSQLDLSKFQKSAILQKKTNGNAAVETAMTIKFDIEKLHLPWLLESESDMLTLHESAE